MKLQEELGEARRKLAEAGIPEAALEAEVLVMEAAGLSRAQLYASIPGPLPSGAVQWLRRALRRRLHREPLAYVTGHREFFGLDLLVDRRALVPRQETETLLERTLEVIRGSFPGSTCRIADVGTGCGAIAVGLAANLPGAHIYATDISVPALELAALNCRGHGIEDRVTLLEGDLLTPLPSPVDVVVANLPYILEEEWGGLQPEICLFEPRQALVAGPTGLECIFRLLEQMQGSKVRPRWLLLELGEGQAKAVIQEATALFPGVRHEVFQDLNGLDRGIALSALPESAGFLSRARCGQKASVSL